ncbi:DUF1481 domain-containing protein [Vibrio ziniensis]|uniref:DUF1481 domain-containing protein n=1 Tax=Vibrio ziniensis TaxID=2711221 RepID=A0A6G7CLN0_9VIBR|nr:DUF1481 domain-containing protein [Vibrio ziniensis]QIH42956.1 DUF1481 domain-containing protein [Vibrio ziniensis]
MKKILLSLITTAMVVGCSSSATSNFSKQSHYSGGQRVSDTTHYYWFTESTSQSVSAADHVTSETNGWYETSYRWDEGNVREVVRKGEQLKAGELVPYTVHVRFNKDGEAVYQQYRVEKKILPLNEGQLERYVLEAESIGNMTKDQNKKGLELLQGFWDGTTFELCNGKDYTEVEFNNTLPSFVMSRLSSLDNYIGFLGKIRNNTVYIDELLILADDDYDCVERPNLID